METLHSILLGPYKYLLKATIPRLSAQQKEEILSRIRAFSYSGFRVKLLGNICRYYQSFVGRDFKAWAQMALFILGPYLAEGQNQVRLTLSKVIPTTRDYMHVSVRHTLYHCRCFALLIVTTFLRTKLMSGKPYASPLSMLSVKHILIF